MRRLLIAVGLQKSKLEECGRDGKKIVEWVGAHQSEYDGIIAVVRKDLARDNFDKMNDEIENRETEYFEFLVDTIIEVPGYDIDCKHFTKDAEYHIVGISTSASILCMAMSMFSNGFNIKVLVDRCTDRKGKNLHKNAVEIMKAYMPISVVD